MQTENVRERTHMHVSLNCAETLRACAAHPPCTPCMHVQYRCRRPIPTTHASSASHIWNLEPPKGARDGSSSPGTGPQGHRTPQMKSQSRRGGIHNHETGRISWGPGQQRPRAVSCHTRSRVPSADGKHGGVRLLVFNNRRGSRTICPNAIQMLQRDRRRIEQECGYRRIRQRLAAGMKKRCVHQSLSFPQLAPRLSRARLSSRTAVGTSSKLRAEMAHFACFCA